MKITDLDSRFGSREICAATLDSSDVISYEKAHTAFPEANLSKSEHVIYFPFKLCHSLPVVNQRSRAFVPRVLAKSFASLVDQLVNYEHQVTDNNPRWPDKIIGHVKAVRFDLPSSEVASLATIPEKAIPVVGLGCLYMRANNVTDIVKQYEKNPERWRISMECGHQWGDAAFLMDGKEFLPLTEAPDDMLDCIGEDYVRPYKGKKLAVCLGGLDKEVEFWGAALTTNPADTKADILGFVGGVNRELSSRKTFYMPLMALTCTAKEAASAPSEKIKELAAVAVIGETEPGDEDKHTHLILSDGTIMPARNHMHCAKAWNLNAGTKPRFTGVTEPYMSYNVINGTEVPSIHNHLWDVDLKKKPTVAAGVPDDGEEYAADPVVDLSSLVTIEGVTMKLSELLAEMKREIASVRSAIKPEDKTAAETRFNELAAKFEKATGEEEFKKSVREAVELEIKEGRLVTKEKADTQMAEAVAAKEKEVEVEKVRLRVMDERKAKCLEAGMNLGFEFDGVTDKAGKPVTIQSQLETFEPNEDGDRAFAYNFQLWKNMVDAEKTATQRTAEAASAKAEAEKKAKEAAAAPAKKSIVAAGGGPSTNNNATKPEDLGFGVKPEKRLKSTIGIHAFSN